MINLLTNLTSSINVCLKIVNFLEIFLLKLSWKWSSTPNCFKFNVKKDNLTSWIWRVEPTLKLQKIFSIHISQSQSNSQSNSQSHFTFHMQISIVMISSWNFQDANQWKSNGECFTHCYFKLRKRNCH